MEDIEKQATMQFYDRAPHLNGISVEIVNKLQQNYSPSKKLFRELAHIESKKIDDDSSDRTFQGEI